VHDVHPAVLGSTLLIVLGLDSEWTGMAPPLALPGFQEVMFSYRGLNAHDLPLPYPRAATHLPLREVADKIANQVRALVRRGANPIWVLADSEGSLGTQIYLASHPGAPVQRVVFTSPEVAPAQVYYPPRNQSGWGVVSGWVLRGWYKYLETMGWPKALEIVMRSVLEHGPLVARLERCPMSAAPHEVLLPLDTTVTMPFGLRSWIPIKVAGLTHGTMISATKFNSEVRRVLLREPLQQSRWWEAATWLGRAVGASFQLPPLNERLPEAWRADVGQGLDCRQTREAIRRNFAQAVPAHLGGEGTP